jgi:O-antigen/teichoic acid export membrane protein
MEIEISASSLGPSLPTRVATAVCRLVSGRKDAGVSKRTLVALRGSAWTIAGYGGGQVLRVGTQILLARMLLGPQAFGLVALVSVFLSGLELLSDLAVGTDVIQHPRGDDPLFLNTAFWIQSGRGLILCLIAAALAYPFANFYGQPAVRSMIFLAAVSVGLRGFASSSIWTMTRHLQIPKVTMVSLGGDCAGFLVALAWALFSPTAWALVAGRVASSAVYMVASHLVAENRVSPVWDSCAARDILIFGTGMFFSSATYFISGEAERLVIGKFITLAELGCFSLALGLSWGPSKALQQVVSQVFYPMFAHALREKPSSAVRDYQRVRLLLLVASATMGCGFILFGPLTVRLLLGPKYHDAGWMLQLLGFRAAAELFSSTTTSVLFATGVSRFAAIGNISKLIFLCFGLAVAFGKFGFREAVWVLALSQLVNYLPQNWALRDKFPAVWKMETAYFIAFLVITTASALLTQLNGRV